MPFTPGDKGAHLYESRDALPLIFAVDNLEAARAAQARSQASLNAVREEDLRKQRIPIQIVDEQNMRDFELYLFLDLNGHLVGRLFPSTLRAWILPLCSPHGNDKVI